METFTKRVLLWYERHGRRHLPWKQHPTAYGVWISEVMLQQTQVTTVVPYYARFMSRFPSVRSLAQAPLDDVLHYWSGLGYYARARNLHAAARLICDRWGGRFPTDFAILNTLPGIGRSTAGAILALACDQRYAILDGNAKRVLTRFHAVDGWSGTKSVTAKLWALADWYTPEIQVADYTQAIMDLGATVCTNADPRCDICPLNTDCKARRLGRQSDFPVARPKRSLPVRATVFAMLRNPRGAVLLERRPPSGVWGGLWAFPECPVGTDLTHWCQKKLGQAAKDVRYWTPLRHTFTHFHLDITPVCIDVDCCDNTAMDPGPTLWYKNTLTPPLGLAAPVKKLISRLMDCP